MMRFLCVAFVCLSVFGSVGRAQYSEARALYEAGVAAFEDGRYQDALERWESAYSRDPRPQLLFNLGTAAERLARFEDARAYYRLYLEQAPDAPNITEVRSRLARLDAQIASTERRNTPEIADEPVRALPVAEETPAEVDASTESSAASPVGPVVTMSLGGGLLIAGAVMAAVAQSRHSFLTEQCPMGRCPPELRDDADELDRAALAADVLVMSGAAAALGGVLWFLLQGDDDEASTEASVQPILGPSEVGLRGRF